MQIPFNRPSLDKRDYNAAAKVLKSGEIGGNGPVCRQVEDILKAVFQVKHSLLMTSCTHSLEAAVRVLRLSPGDQVILPSFAFPSAANAVLLAGAEVVFADITTDSLNIDPEDIARKITPRTRAILPVHYAGVSCNMDRILELAAEFRLYVLEDAAQCIGSKFRGKPLGSIGDIGCVSFHETKNIICGEGGTFLTDSDEFLEQADIIREKGTNRSRFLRGEIDKYYWVDIGSSYVLSELQAAILLTQLDKIESVTRKRAVIYNKYRQGLEPLESSGKISLGKIAEGCDPNYHIFYFLVERGERDSCLQRLKKAGIGATTHFYPLHLSEMGKRLGYRFGELPVTEEAFKKLIRLPIYTDLKKNEINYIIDTLIGIMS